MSYSFTVRAATKSEAKAKIAEQFAALIAAQPLHDADKDQAMATVNALIDILGDDASKDVFVGVNGHLARTGDGQAQTFIGAGLSVGATLAPKEAP